MIFRYITIQEGFLKRTFRFEKGVNLIFSNENTRGKTSLIRFMLYSLGYNIPHTRNFRFDNCSVVVSIECERQGEIILSRNSIDSIELKQNGKIKTFVLPEEIDELHKIIFQTENLNIVHNVLGAIYADQEKGWTLLNRGTTIGSLHFNIEELIRGLSNCNCEDLLKHENQLTQELARCRQMLQVAQYRDSLLAQQTDLTFNDNSTKYEAEINQLLIQQKSLQKEINRINQILKDNKRIASYIEEMKLLVKLPDGTHFPITSDSIIGLADSIDFLVSKRKIVSSQLSAVARQIETIDDRKKQDALSSKLFETENLLDSLNKKIATLPVNASIIEREIRNMEKRLKDIRKEISKKTLSNSKIMQSLYTNMVRYASELGVGSVKTLSPNYLFTSNLKELSGAVLHKMVFAFRLAYILEIEKNLNIKLPIVLDSPSGKEVDSRNIQLMMNILKRDFNLNQIIIASIFRYDFDKLNIIEIHNRLIESEI